MNNTITISVDALTEKANAQIQGFFQKIDLSAKALNRSLASDPSAFFASAAAAEKTAKALGESASKSANSLKGLGASSMGLTSAMRVLNDVSLLTGGTRMRELSFGVMGAASSFRLLRSLASLTGLSLGTLVPVLGGIGAAVGAGALIWNGYNEQLKKAEERAKATGKSLEEMPAILDKITKAQQGGLISAKQAKQWTDTLGLTASPGNTTNSVYSPYSALSALGSGFGMPGSGFQNQITPRTRGNPEALAQVQKEMQAKGLLTANNNENPEFAAAEQLGEIREKLNQAALTGVEKEKAASKAAYDDIIQQIETRAALAGKLYSDEQHAADIKKATEVYNSEVLGIQFKKSEEEHTKAIEASSKAQEELEKGAAKERAKLEEDLTLADEEQGQKRGHNYEEEFKRRVLLVTQQKYAGEISEDEYTKLVKEASIKRLAALNREADQIKKLAEAQAEIDLARIQGQRHLIETDPSLSQAEKKNVLLAKLREENVLLEKNLAIYEALAKDPTLSAEGRIAAVRKVEETQQRHAELQQQISTTASSGTFGGEMSHAMTEMKDEFGSVAQQIAQTFKSVIGTAIDTVSKSITGVIMGTEKWGTALKNIAGSVMNQVISSIIKMGVEYVVTHGLMKAALIAFHAVGNALKLTSAATATAANTAQIPSATTLAAVTSVGSYGAAAAEGAAALVAAMGVMMGAMGGGQYAEGGRPPVGLVSLVGERGPELFVPDQPGTIFPADETSAMLRHGGGRQVPGATTLRNDNRVSLVVHDDRQNALDAMKSAEGRALFVQLSKEHRHEI